MESSSGSAGNSPSGLRPKALSQARTPHASALHEEQAREPRSIRDLSGLLHQPPAVVVVAALGFGLLAAAFKLVLLSLDVVPFNADEAIVALMARHILGGSIPIFFYGQAYMGSLDALFAALAFRLLGESVSAIRYVQIVLYTATVASGVYLAWRVHRSAWVAAAVGLLLAIPAVNVTLYTTVSLGGYGEALLIGNLLMLAAWACWENPRRPTGFLAWGFLAGFGMWVFGMVIVFIVPTAVLLVLSLRSLPPRSAGVRLGGAAAASLVGLAPWLIWIAGHGVTGAIEELAGIAIAGAGPAGLLAGLAYRGLNLALFGSTVVMGMRPPWGVEWLAPWLMPVALGFWLAVAGFSIRCLRQPDAARAGRYVLAGVVAVTLLGFVLTPFGADPSGRYFLPLLVPMAIFAGELLSHIRDRWGGVASASILAALTVFHLASSIQVAWAASPGFTTQFDAVTWIDHAQDAQLVRFLQDNGEQRGYTNYWVAYPLSFLSQEELLFVPALPYHPDLRYSPRDDRYPPYTALVEASQRVAYITTGNPTLEQRLRLGFTKLGVEWREAVIGDYHVFYDLSRPARPADLDLRPVPAEAPEAE